MVELPHLSKSTSTPPDIRRRLDLRRSAMGGGMADPLTDRINQLSLQSHRQEQKRRVDEAKTPKKRSGQQQHDRHHDHHHDRNQNQNQNHPSQNSHRSLAALPSPGLRRIRERLGVPDLGEGGGDGPATLAAAEEARRAATAAARAAAQAEADAARAIDAILEQQEGLLAAMSAALALPGGGGTTTGEEAQQAGGKSAPPSASSMRSAVTAKIVECIEEATKAELLKLPGVAREGADIRGTAVYWIAMARFEESHDRAGGAGAYLREGVEHIEAGAGAGSSTQVGALRLALERLEAGAGAGTGTGTGARTRPPRPLPAAGKEEEASEGAAAAAPRKSPRRKGTAAAPESPALTPTRRSIRIQARSAEKEGAPRGRGGDGTVRGVSAGP